MGTSVLFPTCHSYFNRSETSLPFLCVFWEATTWHYCHFIWMVYVCRDHRSLIRRVYSLLLNTWVWRDCYFKRYLLSGATHLTILMMQTALCKNVNLTWLMENSNVSDQRINGAEQLIYWLGFLQQNGKQEKRGTKKKRAGMGDWEGWTITFPT